jgi:hypothetical protein
LASKQEVGVDRVVDAREALRGKKCAERSILGAQEAGHTQFQSTRRSRGRSCTDCAHEIGGSGTSDELGWARYGRSLFQQNAYCFNFQQTAGSVSPRAVDCSAFRGRGKRQNHSSRDKRKAGAQAAGSKERQRGGPLCGAASLALLPAPWTSIQLVRGRLGCSRSALRPDPVIFRPFAEPQPPSLCDSSFPLCTQGGVLSTGHRTPAAPWGGTPTKRSSRVPLFFYPALMNGLRRLLLGRCELVVWPTFCSLQSA